MKRRWASRVIAVIAVTAGTLAVFFTAVQQSAGITSTTTPVRAAFYYPWYPETESWATHYSPALGKYDSSNRAILAAHVAMAKYAGLDAFISSWWGQGTPTDQRLPLLLDAARAQGFHVAPYYEPEGKTTKPTDAELASDFTYLFNLSNGDPAWLTMNGKPVLFIYNTDTEATCTGVARLVTANAGRFYIDTKVFSGYRTCATQPDSWHQYGPAAQTDTQSPYSYSVSPGFFKFNETTPRLARDLVNFKAALQSQIASGAQWQLMTTFNEWGEGTSVEPAAEWQSSSGYGDYLDAMHVAYTGSPIPVPTPSTSTTTTTTTPPPTTTSTTTTTPPPTTTSTTTPPPTTTSTTTTPPPPPPANTVTKVLLFVEENHSLNEMKSGMPYVFSQAQQYGYATNYKAASHPSLPNYLAMTFGSTLGVTDDSAPSAHPEVMPDVFTEAIQAGRTAKSYQESMTSNCATSSSGAYAVKHNPWAYDTTGAARTLCQQFDVPSGTVSAGALHNDIVNGTLPNVGEVTPNLNNDAHDGSLATADTWFKNWFTLIQASPDWKSGHLAVIVNADEDDSSQSNLVLMTVLHPSQAHHVVSTALNHYSMTKLLNAVGHSACARNGCSAADIPTAFGFTVG